MDDSGLLGAVKTLATDTAIHFKRHPFELKSVGMLISGSVVGRKKPEKILKSLEEMLYGCSDTTGIVVKSLLIGQKEFCRRVEELRKLLLQS